jgi:UDP-glucose 4-epimerase
MDERILVTGSAGLIGRALAERLATMRFDLREKGASRCDVRDRDRVDRAVRGADGIVHLAAISRVVWGERDPAGCWATNVGGLRNVIAAAARSPRRPWLIFASSREVYGQPERLPATEDCARRPVNVYGRSKLAGELLVEAAQRRGLRACIVRLSNVYGATSDHADRVTPAFASAAARGGLLRVDGAGHTFDFTHLDDVVAGIVALIARLRAELEPPPPIHLVSGVPTSLAELARLAIDSGERRARAELAPARDFDVAHFVGDPARARALLGWEARIALREGLARLVADFAHREARACDDRPRSATISSGDRP